MTVIPPIPVPSRTPVSSASLVDARPILPRVKEGIFARVEEKRNQIHAAALEALRRRGYAGNVLRSPPHVYPASVTIEAWLPVDGDALLTSRGSATITLNPKPYFKYEIEYSIKYDCRGRITLVPPLFEIGANELDSIVAYIVGEQGCPKFRGLQLRLTPFQFWKPRNRPNAIGADWLGILTGIMIVLGLVLLPAMGLGLLLILGAVIILIVRARQPIVVRTSGRPEGEPRQLLTLDSWQTVLFDLGTQSTEIRQRIFERLSHHRPDGLRCKPESIWYWGLNGVVDREQIVLTLGRSMLFLHVHAYRDKLYVGWDAHLNRGQWGERNVARGVDKKSGRMAQVKVAEIATQPVTEYDLTDANCLIEWAHAQITQVLKQVIAENKIEQEVDFKIIRAERKGVVTQDGEKKEGSGVGARIKAALRRNA